MSTPKIDTSRMGDLESALRAATGDPSIRVVLGEWAELEGDTLSATLAASVSGYSADDLARAWERNRGSLGWEYSDG